MNASDPNISKTVQIALDNLKNCMKSDSISNLSEVVNHTANKLFNGKGIRDKALNVNLSSSYLVSKDVVKSVETSIYDLICQVNDVMTNLSAISKIQNESNESDVSKLREEIDRLTMLNNSLETSVISLNLEIAKATERITDQAYRINTLTANEKYLNKRIADLSKLNEELSTNNLNMADRLKEKLVSDSQLADISVTEFNDIPFVYALEYLNQFILTNESIYKSTDLADIIGHAIDYIEDKGTSDDPIYIVSIVNSRICSRFDVSHGYGKIQNNTFLYMGKEKIAKKTIVALLQQDIIMLNKSIYSRLKSGENKHEEDLQSE